MSTYRVKKTGEGRWLVWNVKTHQTADIVSFSEYGLFPKKNRYRVDVDGRTVASLLDHFSTARAKAVQCVKA
ncbi:hypothetical protein SAMN02799630_03988 [Paenibacillus sp. UNCCL117]|nr:hypothetical protein SAMN04488602_11353 [Paenibacillus sp. cl123]SFW52598.1 hypothetical protein SAMN02799630_03988 [Paenibacillus sp. UNCCL117]